jgi:ribosomal protein S18 acetylase RimI-like enzyme
MGNSVGAQCYLIRGIALTRLKGKYMDIRPYCGSDEADLLAVWNASMTHDRLSEDLFRTKVLLDANFHPENLPVAIEDGRIVGFVLGLTREAPLFLQGLEPDKAWITSFGVHPDYRGQGIGTALFDYLVQRFQAQGRQTLDVSPYVPNYFVPAVDVNAYPGTLAFMENVLGFQRLYHAISMGVDLTGYQIPPEILELEGRRQLEDEVTIRPATAADLPELMPFIVKHFGWDWYRHSQEYLLEYFGDTSNQICFLVAREHGEIVGYCQQRR